MRCAVEIPANPSLFLEQRFIAQSSFAVATGNGTHVAIIMDGNISATGMPEFDLIIGTGGEYRLFNFLTWQAV